MNLFAVEADVRGVFYHRETGQDMWTIEDRLKVTAQAAQL
jgi:hypothetical protein